MDNADLGTIKKVERKYNKIQKTSNDQINIL